MAENKFVVKTVFHDENGDTLLREVYRETREKAQELKDLADFGYAGGSPKLWGNSFIRPLLVKSYCFYRT